MTKFSVLNSEVDIDHYNNVKKNSKKDETSQNTGVKTKKIQKNVNSKTTTSGGKAPTKPVQNNVAPKKKKVNNDTFGIMDLIKKGLSWVNIIYILRLILNELQNLAFSTDPKKGKKLVQPPTPANVTKPPKEKKSKKISNEEVEEEWKIRDDKYVKGVNEKNLEEAILLSKLENQKRLANGKKVQKENDKPKEPEEIKKKKKKKPTTVSLDEFQRAAPEELLNQKKPSSSKSNSNDKNLTDKKDKMKKKKGESDFFKEVKETTKATILTEKQKEYYNNILRIENRKAMEEKFTSEVEKREFENQALRFEVDSLKNEVISVKQRNKKLCEVIGCSEMKPKGQLVVQLEKATKTRDEYSQEVSKLSIELEQEKTKVSNLTQEIKKLQGRKNH